MTIDIELLRDYQQWLEDFDYPEPTVEAFVEYRENIQLKERVENAVSYINDYLDDVDDSESRDLLGYIYEIMTGFVHEEPVDNVADIAEAMKRHPAGKGKSPDDAA